MNTLNVEAATSALKARKDEDLKDFNFAGCKVQLNWRGNDGAFWSIIAPGLGPFHPPVDIHVKQVQAMSKALVELEGRLAGLACPENELTKKEAA